MDEQFQVTADRPGFAPVPLRLLEDERITESTTVAVYAALVGFIDYGTANCRPSHATIGKRARVSADTAARHLAVLVELGYVKKVASGAAAGTSNRYHLVDPWGRGYRTGAAGGTAPMRQKLDPVNEKREGEGSATAPDGASQPTPAPAAATPPLPILEEIKKEAVARGKGTSWMGPGWAARFERLLREVREVDILPAFRACLDAGGNPYYFPADFAKWQGKATSTTAVTARPASSEHPAARCPVCGEPMMRLDDGWACMPCHERFDRNLKREVLVTVEEIHEATERLLVPAYHLG